MTPAQVHIKPQTARKLRLGPVTSLTLKAYLATHANLLREVRAGK